MPAGSEPGSRLPRTWRPLGVRIAGTVAALLLVGLCVGAWIALGEDIRGRFTLWQRSTLIGLGLMGAVVWLALLRSRVTAAVDEVAVVNGFKRRDLAWAQIVAVRLRRGAPWAEMDLSDGTTIAVMAIQGSDGERARTAVREFRSVLAERTSTDRND